MLTPAQIQLQQHIEQAISQGKINSTHKTLVDNITQSPNDHLSYFLLAQLNLAVSDITKAKKLLEKALSIAELPLYFAHLAKLEVLTGQLVSAQTHIDKAINISWDERCYNPAVYYDIIANVLTRLGHYDKALNWQLKAYSEAPSNPHLSYNLAVGYKVMGQFDKARHQLEKIIHQHPTHFQAHYSLAELNDHSRAKTHLKQVLALSEQSLSMQDNQYAQHAIALNYEHLDEYEKAFLAFCKSKQPIKSQLNYNAELHTQFCKQIIALSEQNQGSQADKATTESSFSPIFIVGMPRSGTTLLEKIINQSTHVHGVGELNDIAQLCQGDSQQILNLDVISHAYANEHLAHSLSQYQQRVDSLVEPPLRSCDKQPFNFYYIDLILRAFPNAKIICMHRGEYASCIANLRQVYSPSSAFHHYSFDLGNIHRFYHDYCSLITHFAAKYANNVMIMQYEELVSEPEVSTQKIYAFCDLPWHESCLDFYKQQSPSATASKVQVRQPLNRKAVKFWQNYQFAVDELKTELN